MTSLSCSQFDMTGACTAMVCDTDWLNTDTAETVRNSYCKALTGTLASCGTTCSGTTWKDACCSVTDWSTCFSTLSKQCTNGGSDGTSNITHALGQTSAISTIVGGHAATGSVAMNVTMTTHTPSSAHTSVAKSTGSTSSKTSSASAASTSSSSAEKSLSVGAKLAVYVLVTGFLANLAI